MDIVPKPTTTQESRSSGPTIWVDEAIWGHRLHDEQSPWLTFLEFLGIYYAENKKGRCLQEIRPNSLSYLPQSQMNLRNILFNNPHMASVISNGQSDESMWISWLELMHQNSGGIENPDFSYLRNNFESFQDFYSVVSFVRGSVIEGGGNKRWTSKFIFPFGESALYEDVNVTAKGKVEVDRLFFARTGEVLYLMLCRSNFRDALNERLEARLIHASNPYNGLARALQGEPQPAKQERSGAFLPCMSHKAFDRLAEDWIAILDLPIPSYDAIPYLVTMLGLNIILYQLERAAEVTDRKDPIELVCEIISPKRSVVRDISANSFQDNNSMPRQAIEIYIKKIKESREWADALESSEPAINAAKLLYDKFDWPDQEDDEIGGTPELLLSELVQKAIHRHKQHVGKIGTTWGRLIGLSSRRSSRSNRYAPTDKFLKTLVISCVKTRVEFKEFLEIMKDRYGLVIGDNQAKRFIESGLADQEDFSDNAVRLEARLASLGLLKRLSDSCAYVENPFRR